MIKSTIIAPTGGPADVCWHQRRIVACWQSGAGAGVRLVTVDLDPLSHAALVERSTDLGDDVGAWPVLCSALDAVWCLYREGKSKGGQVVLTRDGREVWRSSGEAGGNHPACFGTVGGAPWFAWQRFGDNLVRGGALAAPGLGDVFLGVGAADGLSAIDQGRVVLWKDVFGSEPGMTAPDVEGALVAGEHPDSGVIVRERAGLRSTRLWPGEQTVTPRLASWSAAGLHAVVTSGVRGRVDYGVRLATFTLDDLAPVLPAPSPAWDAAGAEVEARPFFDIIGSTVPRVSPDGQVWQAHRVGDEIRIHKGQPYLTEVYRLADDRGVRHAYDATDGRYPRAWRLDVIGDGRTDALWCNHVAFVGSPLKFPGARLIRRQPDGPSTSESFPYATGVEAHGRHVDYGGDVGVVDEVLVLRYEPHVGQTQDGYHELAHWVIKDGRALGFVRYDEIRKGVTTRSFTFNRFDQAKAIPADALIIHSIPDAPAEQAPMPPPSQKPRDQWSREFADVNAFYAAPEGLQRPGGMVIMRQVDGVDVPTCDVEAMQQWGYDLMAGSSLASVLSQIRASDEWKTKHAGDPPIDPGVPITPTSTREGTLFVDGKVFRDAGGKRLPFYIHGGDLISRYSRDADGARRMLDEIVTLRADGGRFWTWLLGQPHWNGRLFRGDWTVLRAFVNECKQRKLRIVLSQGDLWQAGESTARAWLTELASFIRAEGPEWFDFVDGANEGWQNPHGLSPDTIASGLRPLANVGPVLTLTDFLQDQVWPGNTAEERKAAMLREAKRWSQSPAMILDGHPQFSDGDGCIRRTWNFPYELDAGAWINSEPRGFSRNVTVYNRVDRSVQLMLAAATWITSGAYVAMSSPGVISDGTRDGHFDGGESFLEMPGFRDLAGLRAWLPQDVGGWRRVHGGDRPGSPRVFAVENDDTRCDHAINEATGEYVAILYSGPYHQAREASVEDFDPDLGGGRRIVKGRIR